MVIVNSEGVSVEVHTTPDHTHITASNRSLYCLLPWARCQGNAPYTWWVAEPELDWAEVQ